MVRTLFVLFYFILSNVAIAKDAISVAVTASFKPVLEVIAESFYNETNVTVNLSSASTGVLYQQIKSGAPFDIFFAADTLRPALLKDALNLPDNTLRPYALGHLVFYSVESDVTSLSDLKNYSGRVVIANPKLAPYGEAAQGVLATHEFNGSTVLANNVAQARQYLDLGLAKVGLIAASVSQGLPNIAEVDTSLYDVIQQDVLRLNNNENAERFLQFVLEQEEVLRNFGYEPAASL